ncbi:Hypothetical_protein [Hexamita inflata]|uniref:Hypothetical_protein n=1 Tax=Hexamita inflata TaxID=28002 RepID=A0AA86TBM9_9EUKA|nr:Hypothetical protein HINF_LOCUS1979 [Hexamita inflata]
MYTCYIEIYRTLNGNQTNETFNTLVISIKPLLKKQFLNIYSGARTQMSKLERIINKRKKFELKQNENEKLIIRIDKDSDVKFKNIVQMEDDVEYLKYLLESVKITAE